MARRVTRLVLFAVLLALPTGWPAAAFAEEAPAWARVSDAQKAAAAKLGIPVAFENSLGMRFVLVPGGIFEAGPPPQWARQFGNRIGRPAHGSVELKHPFYVQTTEVTNAQLLAVFPDDEAVKETVGGKPANLPVDGITHENAGIWLATLSEQDGTRTYRLPTEAEWERACSGGERTFWYWGSEADGGKKHEHLAYPGANTKGPSAVGQLEPNPFGLHDMLGNVKEWTLDPFGPPLSFQSDPRGPPPVPPLLEPLFRRRGVRGGHYSTKPDSARRWWRRGLESTAGYEGVGFRAVVPVRTESVNASPRALPLTLHFVKAEDGTALEGIKAKYKPESGDSVPLVEGRVDVVPRPLDSFDFEIAVPGNRRLAQRLDKPKHLYAFVKPAARALRVECVVPLYRPVRVEGRVEVAKGTKMSGIQVWIDRFAGELVGNVFARVPAHAKSPSFSGRFKLDVLPWVPGAPVVVRAEKGNDWTAAARDTMPAKWKRTLKLRDKLLAGLDDQKPRPRTFGGTGIGGTPALEFPRWKHEGAGQLMLRCTDANGKPLEDAVVTRDLSWSEHDQVDGIGDMAITNKLGFATFPVVPAGEHTIEIFKVGEPVWARRMTTGPGMNMFDAQLPKPSRINLHVVRAEGGPAAWANVVLDCGRNYPCENVDPKGTYRVGPALDHEGRGTLHGLSSAHYVIRVYWHGRQVFHKLHLDEGAAVDVVLTLPMVQGWDSGLPK